MAAAVGGAVGEGGERSRLSGQQPVLRPVPVLGVVEQREAGSRHPTRRDPLVGARLELRRLDGVVLGGGHARCARTGSRRAPPAPKCVGRNSARSIRWLARQSTLRLEAHATRTPASSTMRCTTVARRGPRSVCDGASRVGPSRCVLRIATEPQPPRPPCPRSAGRCPTRRRATGKGRR